MYSPVTYMMYSLVTEVGEKKSSDVLSCGRLALKTVWCALQWHANLCDILSGSRCETRQPCTAHLLECTKAGQREISCNLQSTCYRGAVKASPEILTLLDTVKGEEEITQHLCSGYVFDALLIDSHTVQHLDRQWTHFSPSNTFVRRPSTGWNAA